MTRGYYGDPRHEVQKRTYRDCACGRRTWSPRGVCSVCSGQRTTRNALLTLGPSRQITPIDTVRRIIHLLQTTNLLQQDIAEQCDVSSGVVSNIKCGFSWKAITGGPVERPK